MSRPRERRDKGEQDLFRSRLDQIINMNHELVRLADAIDWPDLEERFGEVYSDGPVTLLNSNQANLVARFRSSCSGYGLPYVHRLALGIEVWTGLCPKIEENASSPRCSVAP